ncbi:MULTISPECIES: muconate cycloisomerase family protein [Burkholderiales]|uniref:Chloromuconate cycloisomerase n=3 Tax=Burkholderiales TaxID=80840 RepID=Q9RHQ8_VARPD|nr:MULTISPECIES: muconate cycloisomerase family protein [Burkholderiales]AAK81674.1 chloromuconate cycloisomerase [Burkholderia cepacia]AAS49444.1 TfdD [Achromobacter denitrificans]BAA88065.1 chloromuconate cycloisomerase [Variovorax paradoxus]
MRIESITATIVDVPTRRPLQMSFTTVNKQSYVIVEIKAEGLVGIGEGGSVGGPTWSSESAETIKTIIDTYLTPHLIGKDASNLNVARILMDKAVTGNFSAKAAIDIALHDLKARALNLSVGDLIGGRTRDSIPIAWTLASGDTQRDIDSALEMIEARRHNRFKVKLGVRAPAEDLQHIRSIIKAVGNLATVRVDINQAWDEQTASIWIPRLEEAGVELVEQPVSRSDFRALRRLTEQNGVAILADESLSSLSSAFELARDRAADVFSLKLCNMGGIANTLKVATLAEAAGISAYGGTMLDSTVGTAAALHVYSTIPSMPYGCELLGPWVLADRLTQQELQIKDFEIQVPSGIGLGVDLDHDKIRHYSRGG